MKMTFRWYGKNSDSVTLKQIRQIPGMSGIMGFLDYKPAGEVWTKEEIKNYVDEVHEAGLECEVIESVNVHEDIKLGLDTRDKYIDNYCETVKNLSEYGVKVIIYNFMPVFDWLRTDLNREIEEDGSNSLYFSEQDLGNLTPLEIVKNTADNSHGFSLPGWEPERLKDLERVLNLYKDIDEEKLFENYKYFLKRVIPVCEKYDVRLACHPDDPAWPIFNLPRIAHSLEQFERIIGLVDSPYNTINVCTGSLASNVNNDVVQIIRELGKRNRIAAVHVRNIKHLGSERCFRESAHLSKCGDLDMYEIMKAIHDYCPDVYIRPDHGRMIWDEVARPGYGLYDRALGACYLNGLYEAIEKGSN
ncbi:MAG: mannonate dehydratase [Erysipelotrichaceae bacterium]